MTPEAFAYNEYKDHAIYTELARREKIPDFKRILEELIRHEKSDFEFWRGISQKKEFHVGRLEILFYVFTRKIFGLTFTAKFLEGREKITIQEYDAFLETVKDPGVKEAIEEIVEHERKHERQLIGLVKEEKVAFTSSIILGLNDGLIELTGALVGFSFALRDPSVVALTGFITGIAASLSMASSAYMQARHEVGKDPKRAAWYTGVTYFLVALTLVTPFLVFENIFASLGAMLALVFLIIALTSFYTSVLFERHFGSQIREMLFWSLGVALVTFLIGLSLRVITGINV